jgi:hypothetical protein
VFWHDDKSNHHVGSVYFAVKYFPDNVFRFVNVCFVVKCWSNGKSFPLTGKAFVKTWKMVYAQLFCKPFSKILHASTPPLLFLSQHSPPFSSLTANPPPLCLPCTTTTPHRCRLPRTTSPIPSVSLAQQPLSLPSLLHRNPRPLRLPRTATLPVIVGQRDLGDLRLLRPLLRSRAPGNGGRVWTRGGSRL